jgi:hypothetical protein
MLALGPRLGIVVCLLYAASPGVAVEPTEPATQKTAGEFGLAVGKKMPFHVVNFVTDRGGAGCPSVMISNARTRGVIVWTRATDDGALRLAKALDETAVDGCRLCGFLVAFDEAGNGVRERAVDVKYMVLGKARSTAEREFDARGVDASIQTLVFFLDRKDILAMWSFAADELTDARIAEITEQARKFAADSWPVLAQLASNEDLSIPLAFPDVDNQPRLDRVFRTAAEWDDAFSPDETLDAARLNLVKRLGREIDWKREMVMAISGGATPDGLRYRVWLQSLQRDGNVLVATYTVTKTDSTIDGIDGGVTLAIVPHFAGDVQFVRAVSN